MLRWDGLIAVNYAARAHGVKHTTQQFFGTCTDCTDSRTHRIPLRGLLCIRCPRRGMRAAEASHLCPGIVLVHVETISEGAEVRGKGFAMLDTEEDSRNSRRYPHVAAGTGDDGQCSRQSSASNSTSQNQTSVRGWHMSNFIAVIATSAYIPSKRPAEVSINSTRPDRRTQKACLRRYRWMP